MGVTKFERFFRSTAGADVDNQDLKRYSELVRSAFRHSRYSMGKSS
jgi:uncharacterized protein (UPF0303 family)